MFDGYDVLMMMAPRRPVYVTPGSHPFEVMILAACVAVGAILAVTGYRPPTLVRGLPESLMTAWLALVSVGGAVGLVGAYWRRALDDALLIEFAGVVAIASACSLYVVSLFALNPASTAAASGGLLAGIAAGAWCRAVQCLLDRRRVRSAERAQHAEPVARLPLLVEPDVEPGSEP